MGRTLRQLIEDEHFACLKLESRGRAVERFASEMSECNSDWYKFYEKEHDKAIRERDDALAELETVRKELKQYLVDIINNY